MPTRRPSEITSRAPTLYSAIFSIASNTDCRGSMDRTLLLSLVFSNDPIVSVSFIGVPGALICRFASPIPDCPCRHGTGGCPDPLRVLLQGSHRIPPLL